MRSEYQDLLLFGAYSVCGALVFVGAKLGMPDVPPLLFAALRLDVAGVALLAVAGWRVSDWRPRTRRDVLDVAVVGVFTLGVMNAMLLTGQQYVTSAVGAITYSFMPILTTGFAVLLLPSASLDRLSALGILLGFVGVGIVAQPSPTAVRAGRLVGFGLMVGSVAIFAFGTVVTQRMQPSLPRVALTAWGVALAAVVNHGIAVAVHQPLAAITWSADAIAGVLVEGVLATAVLYAVHFDLIDRIGPARTSLSFYVQPIVAAPLGLLLFDNGLSRASLVGFGVIFVGFVLVERRVFVDTCHAWLSRRP
ncbi:drug/metabolite transporter (DMT)-like permease [Halarchaeum rubridurum]|uniref:Drug/metabolite transporter (DMT)-like permease n=1 Tax=Halarchaeum rubridurum TaxID=489911 RepID=A0A830FYG0_9EURY|nr:DMT family transporter [Halarchaeum rubridurum]MBP1954760.1 drug/metabolite transporter (DMT)-like permease [Halarchaeum rubridurum]GGM59553.1 EamA family transporter [Halarchaeum rubridurum]